MNSDAIEKIAIENLEELDNIKAFDEDRLVFGTNKFNKIRILGAVQNPGEYLVKQGDGVLEGIKRAGGYTQNAYPFGGILENEQTAEINAMAAKMLYKTFLDTLSVVQQLQNPLQQLLIQYWLLCLKLKMLSQMEELVLNLI